MDEFQLQDLDDKERELINSSEAAPVLADADAKCGKKDSMPMNPVAELAKEKFRKLICMTQEMCYLDFKKIYHVKQTTDRAPQSTHALRTDEADDNKDDTQVKPQNSSQDQRRKQKLISDVMIDILSMYNAIPTENSQCETSISGRGTASYIVIGVEYHPGGSARMVASPLTERPDEADYQTVARQITPNIDITYFEIAITEHDIANTKQLWPEWIKQGFYGLLEIVDGTTGPAFPSNIRKNKSDATHLYSRTQGRNIPPIELRHSDCEKIYNKFAGSQGNTTLIKLESYLKRHESVRSFKILIVNGKPDNPIEEDVKELWQSLGIIPWDIVFDIDEQSRVDGVYKSFVCHQKKQSLVTYPDEIKPLCENEIMRFQTGRKVLYVLMRGEAEAGKMPLRDTKWKHNIGEALVTIFDTLRPHTPIMCFHAFSSRHHLNYFQQLHKLIMEKREAADATQNSAVTTIVCSISKTHLEEHYTGLSNEPKGSADVIEMVVAPVRQIHNCIAAIFGSHQTAQYTFPGYGGETHLTIAEYRRINDMLTLYHTALGEEFLVQLKTEEERNQFATEERLNFLRGNEITTSNLYIHEKMGKQTYVDRAEYEDIHKKAIILLREISEKFIRSKNRIDIKHERSAGGTTAGKVLLWKLHKQYPCVHLHNVPDMHEVYEALALLYAKAHLPLVILIDSKNISSDILISYLKNTPLGAPTRVKALVVSVKEATNQKKGRANLDDNESAFEKTILQQVKDQRNQEAFERLYKEAIEDEQQRQIFKQTIEGTCAPTVFLYGLAAFTQHYKKLGSCVEGVVSKVNQTQLVTLFVTAMVTHYTSQPLACELVAALLNIEDFLNLEKNINQTLGPAAELVQIVQSDYRDYEGKTGVRPITANVGDLIIDMDANSKAQGRQGAIDKFLRVLHEVFLSNYDSKDLALNYLITQLFIDRGDEELDDNDMESLAKSIKKNKFSKLVSEMSKVMGKDKTAEMLDCIAQTLPQGQQLTNHFRANTMARFLMYEKHDRRGALKQICLALRVKDEGALLETESNDATLLGIAGYLLRLDVSLELKTKMTGVRPGQSGQQSFLNHCLEYARRWFDVAITLLRGAQNISRSNSYPYVTEAQIYVDYLTMHFKHVCGSNPAKFTEYVFKKSTDMLLSEGEIRAVRCLSKLELLMAQEHLLNYMTTLKILNDIQRRLFSLRVDKKQRFEEISNKCDSVTASCMAAYAMDTYNKKFHVLDGSVLAKIYDVLSNRRKEDMTSSMYYQLVQCIILLNQPPMEHVRGNTDYLSTRCDEWAGKANDFRPHFYIAMLNLLKAINSIDNGARSRYFGNFDKEIGNIVCFNSHETMEESKLYSKGLSRRSHIRRPPQFRKSRFLIGRGHNVDALIPIYSGDLEGGIDISRLRPFTGVVSDGRIFCNELNRSFPVMELDMGKLQQKEKPHVEFYIQASYDGLQSYRPHPVQN